MANLTASPNPVVVDNTIDPPQVEGSTRVRYGKDELDELWHIKPDGAGWEMLNPQIATGGIGDFVHAGNYRITLEPGQVYRAGVFTQFQGPLAQDVRCLAALTVVAMLKDSAPEPLIVSYDSNVGGTWYKHVVTTRVPTTPALVGVSSDQVYWSDGLPVLEATTGDVAGPLLTTTSHTFEILPLTPGHEYDFAAILVDNMGNWNASIYRFDTHRRRLTVKFERVHIYNDGDPGGHGNAEFYFHVFAGAQSVESMHLLERFHLPEMDIDDWGKTDRPYDVGFAYIENEPMSVPLGRKDIYLQSTGYELDGIEGSEKAQSLPVYFRLPLPIGQQENVVDQSVTFYCPPADENDFEYGVDVNFSAHYEP